MEKKYFNGFLQLIFDSGIDVVFLLTGSFENFQKSSLFEVVMLIFELVKIIN